MTCSTLQKMCHFSAHVGSTVGLLKFPTDLTYKQTFCPVTNKFLIGLLLMSNCILQIKQINE